MESWFFENQTGDFGIKIRIKSILHHEYSKFQEIAVYDTDEFGKMLVLDQAVMFTDKNEFVYHEMLGLVPLFAHKNPKRILIIGGGDGGVIRECLKNPFVEHIDLVEIDRRVIDLSEEFFPEIACKLNDPKVRILAEDGIKFLKNVPASEKYDIVLVDSTDPVGPAEGLFKKEFYESAANALQDDGIFVAQTESPFFKQDLIKDINNIYRQIFPISYLYCAMIPVYPSGLWSFSVGSKLYDPRVVNDIYSTSGFNFSPNVLNLKYYSPKVHSAAFILPQFIKEILK